MPDVLAKTMAAVVAALLGVVFVALYVTSRPPVGANEVVAEFRNAFPLIEGMHVRVDGAIAGSVGEIEVTDDGLAAVTLILNETIEDPASDATASIRQQDTTGDSYVAFEPGTSDEPLPELDGKPTIACDAPTPADPCQNTLVAPRFDDLLNAFGPAERAGVKLILSELANALDERGMDLNHAALELRPALIAANEALAEVNSQNAALRSLIDDAEAVTGQAASRREELNRLIDSLARTLDVTAESSEALDAGLADLPETTRRARSTLSRLADLATEGLPLAEELSAGAPQLASLLEGAPAFLDDAEIFVERTMPTLELTRELLVAGHPTIAAEPEGVVTGPFDLAPALSNLLTGILGDENTFQAFFGDDSGGVGPGTLGKSGFGAIAVEPGDQPGYPASHANRNFLRVSGVMNCEVFGVPVGPGCLVDYLTELRAEQGATAAGATPETASDDGGAGEAEAGPEAESPGDVGGPDPGGPLGELGDLGPLEDFDEPLDESPVSDLLDFLLGA